VYEDAEMIEALIAKRAEAKKNKDFAAADAIRDELAAMGITIKDTRQGVQWFRN
jgi:cysteinyl-tRNA synthetase